MNYYIDINLFPDAEIPAPVLMNATYSKLHKALYDIHATTIGVSFPKANITLCNLLRLHGSQSDLAALQQKNWLGGMSGYCKVSEVMPVPDSVQYRTVSRKQSNMTKAKLNRLIKRGSITEAEIKQYKAKMFSQSLDNSYIELVSGSNGHRHRRFIEFGPIVDSATAGKFDQFGLSKIATIPWF